MVLPDLELELAPGVKVEFVKVPAGEFLMGSDKRNDPYCAINETPQFKISLEEYWIGKYPVTNLQFWTFDPESRKYSGDKDRPDAERLPMTGMYLKWAIKFCDWASEKTGRIIRLPNEPEWEKAARGTDGRIWPWGNNPPNGTLCNFAGSGIRDTTPVGRYSPQGDSPYGCADIAGNVFELTRSLERRYPYAKNDGREDLNAHSGLYIVRGGYHSFAANMIRCAVRWSGVQSSTGFRLVMQS